MTFNVISGTMKTQEIVCNIMDEEPKHFEEPLDSFVLMKYILTSAATESDASVFTCPIGLGPVFMQRVRMRISRLRSDLRAEGKVLVRFKLQAQINQDQERLIDVVTIRRIISKSNTLEMALDKIGIEEGLNHGVAV